VAKFSTSQFPATNDVSRQIGAATYTVAVRSQHKANYTWRCMAQSPACGTGIIAGGIIAACIHEDI